jgi:microcystin-dependent protein
MFAGNFPPNGWMTCDGQTLAISEYDTLFNLIGTTYGGDGQSTFNLPSLAGRVPVHMGTGRTGTSYVIGQNGGVSSVTLSGNQTPQHSHPFVADNNGGNTNQAQPTNNFYGAPAAFQMYSNTATGLHPMMTLGQSGGSQPHENMQPYLAITYIISLYGIYPSPT